VCFTNTSSFELSVTKEQWAPLKKCTLCNIFTTKGQWYQSTEFFRSGQMNIFVVLQMGEFGI
jgi:hypothetical protein